MKTNDEIFALLTENNAILKAAFPTRIKVGDFYGGGVVFWINPDGAKGLVVSIVDIKNNLLNNPPWSNNRNWVATGASDKAIGSGKNNTDLIIYKQDTPFTNESYAAWECRHYNGGGFNDWFLPSQDELNEIIARKELINPTFLENGGTRLVDWLPNVEKDNFYWSSTEYGGINPWFRSSKSHIVSAVNLQNHYNGKGNTAYFVRACREVTF